MVRKARFAVALSGAIGLAFVLSFSVSQSTASTDVYKVIPTSIGNSGLATTAWEVFVATCDTIDSVTFFVGAEQTGQTYTAQIIDSITQAVVWSGTKPSNGWKYKDMGFGVHQPVTRGKKYYLQLGLPGNWNYFYDSTNPYPWGVMGTAVLGPQGGNDLAARVIGRNRIPQTFFGNNVCLECNHPPLKTTIIDTLVNAGITLVREQIPWYHIQPDTGQSTRYNWDSLDNVVYSIGRRNIPILYDHFGFTPKWASSWDSDSCGDTTTAKFHSAPPRDIYNADTLSNPFYMLMRKLVLRYGPSGDYWNYPNLGYYVRQQSGNSSYAIQDWEINNEVNLDEFWGAWCQKKYYKNLDPSDYDKRALLYASACSLAYNAIKTIDQGARIYTNGVDFINGNGCGDITTGKQWLTFFYNHGGKNYTDAITWHSYQPDIDTNGQPYNHKFHPDRLQMDYDSLRAVLTQKGDGLRPVWDDEIGWSTGNPAARRDNVDTLKQADIIVQLNATGINQLTNPRGPLDNISWFSGYDWNYDPESTYPKAGLVKDPWHYGTIINKPSDWAYKQMSGKLKDKHYNRQVPLGNPGDSVYCYEFQIPGSDTTRKTWVLWKIKKDDPKVESLSVRTNSAYYDSTYYRSSGYFPVNLTSQIKNSGKVWVTVDTIPIYLYEDSTVSLNRPDIIVDSLYTYPPTPKAGDYVFFYARLKNIGNATLSAGLGNAVKFQVDGVTKATYNDSRAIMPDSTIIVGYNPFPPPQDGSICDWRANYGDHLIRAWADSADRYVELREDNNQAYIFRHMAPAGKIIIPTTGYNQGYPTSGRKFSNTRYVNLSLLSNGGTTMTRPPRTGPGSVLQF